MNKKMNSNDNNMLMMSAKISFHHKANACNVNLPYLKSNHFFQVPFTTARNGLKNIKIMNSDLIA